MATTTSDRWSQLSAIKLAVLVVGDGGGEWWSMVVVINGGQ